jgi:hypothetical protein
VVWLGSSENLCAQAGREGLFGRTKTLQVVSVVSDSPYPAETRLTRWVKSIEGVNQQIPLGHYQTRYVTLEQIYSSDDNIEHAELDKSEHRQEG